MARTILLGRAGSPGVGLGRLLVVAPPSTTAAASHTAGNGRGPTTVGAEHARLADALDRCATELEALAVQTTARAGAEVGAIFEAQALFARDPGIVSPAIALVVAGSSAEEAILRATSEQADVLAAVDDDYFRERAADVRDVGRRVAAILSGGERPDLWHPDGTPAVLVAADLDPSAVATLRPELVAGIALAGGAPTGHAAIVARALGIPLVLGLGEQVASVDVGMWAAVDGDRGWLLLEPEERELPEPDVPAVRGPAVESGRRLPVAIAANIGSAHEAELAAAAGADAIGLVRTELLFLGRSAPPSVAEQASVYRRIRAAFGDDADRPI